MNKKGVSTLKVAATYIGTIIGAGFATGQEILQFFNEFGAMGLVGILIATIMFVIFGYIIMDLGRRINASSHLEIIKLANGNILGSIFDIVITAFLFVSFTTMIAGSGAIFDQQFNLPALLGSILMAVLTAITVLTGIKGIINSISFVVPFLLAAVVGISIFAMVNAPPGISAEISNSSENFLLNNWFLSAVLYSSYNIIISISILAPLGSEAKDKRALKNGAILGGIGLGFCSIMIYLALSSNISQFSNLEVPMLYLAGKISYGIQIGYSVVLTAEVYTTAVSSLYGFISRIAYSKKDYFKNLFLVTGTTIAAIVASQFGFSNIVKIMYPLIGYGGIIILVSLIYAKVKFMISNT